MLRLVYSAGLIVLATFIVTATSSADIVVDNYTTDWVSQGGSVSATQDFGGTGTWGTQAIATTDYTGTGDYQFIDVTTLGASGQWLVTPGNGTQTATLTLSGVAAFDSIRIDRLLLAGGGGVDSANPITVNVNGTTIFNNWLPGRDRPAFFDGSYGASAPLSAILVAPFDEDNNNTAGNAGPGFEFLDNRVGAWGHDSLYDLGQDPAFSDIALAGSGTVTIEIIGGISDGNSDERLAIGNLGISFKAVPEPSSLALIGSLAGCLLVRRRR